MISRAHSLLELYEQGETRIALIARRYTTEIEVIGNASRRYTFLDGSVLETHGFGRNLRLVVSGKGGV